MAEGNCFMEFLDVSDENGNPTGETVERTVAHEKGILHRTSHVWVLRRRGKAVQVLLQKRCETKDSHPGCFDISMPAHSRRVEFCALCLAGTERRAGHLRTGKRADFLRQAQAFL